jgi:hypothetical protein
MMFERSSELCAERARRRRGGLALTLAACGLAATAIMVSADRGQPVAVGGRRLAAETPPGWPVHIPPPGSAMKAIEAVLGRADLTAKVYPDITELTYETGLRLRVQQEHGLAFVELSAPWPEPVFGIQIDEPLPQAEFDRFTQAPRFSRGVFIGLPAHPHWFVDIDDRLDAVRRLLFIDPQLYGRPADIPGVR